MVTEADAVSVMAALDGEPMGDRQLTVKLAALDAAVSGAAPVSAAAVVCSPRYEKMRRPGEPERKLRPRRPMV